MPARIGFKSNADGDVFVYQETDSGASAAVGQNFTDSSKFKVVVATVPGASPSGSPAQIVVDPSANGNITFTPNGLGDVVISSINTGIMYADTSEVHAISNGTNGQLLIGRTGLQPLWNTLTEGPGIDIAESSGNITISGKNGGFTYTVETGATVIMQPQNAYITNRGTTDVGLELPTTPSVGTTVRVMTINATEGAAIVGVAPTVLIQLGNTQGITITSVDRWCSVDLVCVQTDGMGNDLWQVSSIVGNWTIET